MNKINILIAMTILTVTACTPRGEQVMIQNAKNHTYIRGYHDGCESGRKDAGIEASTKTKDTQLYISNPHYQEGWDAGYKECKFREKRVAELDVNPSAGSGTN